MHGICIGVSVCHMGVRVNVMECLARERGREREGGETERGEREVLRVAS